MTILIFTAILCYSSTINNLYKSPYKQCLDTCSGSNSGSNIECSKICTEEFSKALDSLTTKLVPVLEKYLESSK
jgi:hypothetical protein